MRPGESFPHLAWRGMRVAPFPPPLSRPGKEEGLCMQGGARTLLRLPAVATLAFTLPPWCQEVAPLHSRSFGARAAKWEKGEMPPRQPSCLPLGSRGSERGASLCAPLVLQVSPSVYSLSRGPLVLPDVAGFSLRALSLPAGSQLGPTSTSAPWLARDFRFLCVGSSDSEDKEGGIQTWRFRHLGPDDLLRCLPASIIL